MVSDSLAINSGRDIQLETNESNEKESKKFINPNVF